MKAELSVLLSEQLEKNALQSQDLFPTSFSNLSISLSVSGFNLYVALRNKFLALTKNLLECEELLKP